jgi:polar amino acid transport system substrate-binding protein
MGRHIFLTIILSLFCFGKDIIKVSVHPSAHPFGWHEESQIKGAAFELLKKIGDDLGFEVEAVLLPWARSIEETKAGNIDMILTAFYTEQRAKAIEFLEYYDKVETSVFVSNKSKLSFNKWDDLIGLTGLTIVGDSQGDKWDKFEKENLDVLRVVNIEQVFKMLESKRADYVVFPKVSTLREIKAFGYEGKIVPLQTPVTSQGIYFGVSKKSKFLNLIPQINEKIKLYRANGVYERLRENAYLDLESKSK